MNILVAFASLIVIAILVKFITEKKNQRLYQLLKQFPSHPIYPLIGNIHMLLNPTDGLFEKLDRITQPYDSQVFWFGPIPFLALTKHDDIAEILNQCNDRDTLGLADQWFGQGIITVRTNKEWKKSRRIIKPAFTSEMLSKYLQIINKKALSLVENLQSVADTGEEVDVLCPTMNACLDSIIENMIGITIQNRGKNEEFSKAIFGAFASIFQRIHMPWLFPSCVYNLYLKMTRKTRTIEHLKYFPTQVLRQKLNKYRGIQDQNRTLDDENTSQTVINLLIKASLEDPDITETRMRNDLLQVMVAGCEPQALILSFLMLMLAINQDVQQKVYEEITQLSTSQENLDGTLTENDLDNRLRYLEQCIKETLRLFSPVSNDMRRTHKEISLGDKIIPANVLVLLHIYIANRDSKLYKNPLKWDPEHFSDKVDRERPKTSFITFGFGPRYCLGVKYAMMSIKVTMVCILRKYHLSTNLKEFTNKDLKIDFSIKSKRGYPVRFTSRPERKHEVNNANINFNDLQ